MYAKIKLFQLEVRIFSVKIQISSFQAFITIEFSNKNQTFAPACSQFQNCLDTLYC